MLKEIGVNIDNKEKSYCLGFLLGDSHLQKSGRIVLTIQLRDQKVIQFIQEHIGGESRISLKKDITKRIFPNITLSILKKDFINAKTLYRGELKIDRAMPRIKEELERYLVLGFFDAEGTVTWGHRKDRDRVWHKIAFHSQLKMLEGIQKILSKNGISTAIKPVKNSKHYIIELANAIDILNFYKYIYDQNFFVLSRKKLKFEEIIKALNKEIFLEKGDYVKIISPATFKKYNLNKLYNITFPYNLCKEISTYKVLKIENRTVYLEGVNTPVSLYTITKSNHTKLAPLRIELEELLERLNAQSAAESSETKGSETTGIFSNKE